MKQVTVLLTSAWPTPAGLRRPLEGPIEFSEEEAQRIVENGCGKIVDEEDEKPRKLTAAQAKKAAAEKAAAEKAAAEKAAAEKAAAENRNLT